VEVESEGVELEVEGVELEVEGVELEVEGVEVELEGVEVELEGVGTGWVGEAAAPDSELSTPPESPLVKETRWGSGVLGSKYKERTEEALTSSLSLTMTGCSSPLSIQARRKSTRRSASMR
jgi:hypothetical protein